MDPELVFDVLLIHAGYSHRLLDLALDQVSRDARNVDPFAFWNLRHGVEFALTPHPSDRQKLLSWLGFLYLERGDIVLRESVLTEQIIAFGNRRSPDTLFRRADIGVALPKYTLGQVMRWLRSFEGVNYCGGLSNGPFEIRTFTLPGTTLRGLYVAYDTESG
jgi:hypothetical protein